MTERKQDRPKLKRLTRHTVDVDVDGGTLAPDDGLVLRHEASQQCHRDLRIEI